MNSFLSHDILYIILSRTTFWKKISNHSVSSLILKQIICIDIRANVSRKQNRIRDFFREVNGSIGLQSPYMQIGVKLSVLNEYAAKHLHLHLDPSQSPSRHMGSTARKMPNVKLTIGRVFSYHVSCNLTTLASNF